MHYTYTGQPWYDGSSPDEPDPTEYTHCIYETPDGETVLCCDCAAGTGLECVDEAPDGARCAACGLTLAEQRASDYAATLKQDDDDAYHPRHDEAPF